MKNEHKQKYAQLSLKISYYRKLRGFTQEQLAERIDKNTAFIGAVESPNISRTISIDTLFDLSNALNVPPHKFFLFDDDID